MIFCKSGPWLCNGRHLGSIWWPDELLLFVAKMHRRMRRPKSHIIIWKCSNRIGVKYSRSVVLQVNTHRLTESDFWYDAILSRWRPWRHFSCARVCCMQREKARVLSLYNDMMRKRHGFLQLARHRIKKRVQQDKFWVGNRLYLGLTVNVTMVWVVFIEFVYERFV